MKALKQQIRNLMAQDLMLELDFKNKVLAALETLNESQLARIFQTLETLVNTETEILSKTITIQPHFFHHLQNKILQIMHQEFVKQEQVTQQQAEVELQQEIQNF